MIDIIKSIIGITGNEYDVFITFVCIAFTLFFMSLFFGFVSSLFNKATR